MKTFMSVVALSLLASAAALAGPGFNAAISISDSAGTARATTATMEDEYGEVFVVPNAVFTQVDGHALATALTEGDGTAAAMAEQNGEGDADSDLSSAESVNYIYARAFKDAEEALTYSDSDSYTHTTADEGLFVGGAAYAASGMGIFECDGGCNPMTVIEYRPEEMNEGGALASLITAPYPHQSAVYSRSDGEAFSMGAGFLSGMTPFTMTNTNTEQVAVIDVTGVTGMFADALADSSSLSEAESGL